jgi:hypothetical protein
MTSRQNHFDVERSIDSFPPEIPEIHGMGCRTVLQFGREGGQQAERSQRRPTHLTSPNCAERCGGAVVPPARALPCTVHADQSGFRLRHPIFYPIHSSERLRTAAMSQSSRSNVRPVKGVRKSPSAPERASWLRLILRAQSRSGTVTRPSSDCGGEQGDRFIVRNPEVILN